MGASSESTSDDGSGTGAPVVRAGDRRLLLGALALLLAVNAGCYVQAVYPVYTDSTVTFDPELIGTWIPDNDEDFVFTLLEAGTDMYTLQCDESGVIATFEAHLLELGGVAFLDIYPGEPESENSFYKDHLMRLHNIFRVHRDADTLVVADFDAEWLTSMIDQKKVALAHVTLDGAMLITAPTADLQTFAGKYAKTPEAFSKPVRLRRSM